MRLPEPLRNLLARASNERKLGPFLLERPLGEGGFAPVWRAREVYEGTTLRTAAVKLFSIGKGEQASDSRARVLQEAQALCRVEHPNIVRFYSLIIDEPGGVLGLAMELVEGQPLDEAIKQGQGLPVEAVLRVGSEIASALEAVHRAGLVHRDVKPANIIDAIGVHKLIDFGIAAAEDLARGRPSVETAVLDDLPIDGDLPLEPAAASASPGSPGSGTPGYMDPACLASHQEATPASDIYALGASLFEALTGRLPAEATGGGWDTEILLGRAPAPKLSRPDVPEGLAVLLAEMLDPSPERRPGADAVLPRLRLLQAELRGARVALPPEELGPFRGLAAFEASDRGVYFGRVSEQAAALEMMRSRGVVALVGPSGSGKSSLARAGVIPAVQDGNLGAWPRSWRVVTWTPGTDGRAALAEALGVDLRGWSVDRFVSWLREESRERGQGQLLFIDQFEEIVTTSTAEARGWHAGLLAELGERPIPGVRVLVTMRRDLLDGLLAVERLGRTITRGMVLVEPLSAAAWSDAIEQALRVYGYRIEDDALRDDIVADLGNEASAMPLLQFALTELWQRRDREARRLTRQGFDAIGGVHGALERHAQRCADALGPDARGTLQRTLLALTTPQGTRRMLPLDQLTAMADDAPRVIRALEAARILVKTEHGVTLAHEILLRSWPLLRGWILDERADRQLAEELESDAARWGADPESVPLWRKRRLASAVQLAERGRQPLSPAALRFLQASTREDRRAVLLAGGLIAVLATATMIGVGMYLRDIGAERERTRVALAGEKQNRIEAERRATEVQQAQERIDKLLRELADSPKKDEILRLQEQIRQDTTAPARSASPALAAARPPPARAPSQPASSATAAPPPAAVKPASTPAQVGVEKDW